MTKNRYFILDLFRFIAIILMFITHTYRIQIADPTISNNLDLYINEVFEFFMYIEPFTSALFLFLMGFSLKHSFLNSLNIKEWDKKHLKKAFYLILISAFIHIPYHGLNILEVLVSSGILMSIAISMILIIFFKNNIYVLTFLSVILAILIESLNITLMGVNAGAGAILPVIIYGFIGFIAYDLNLNNQKRSILFLIFISFYFIISKEFRYDVSFVNFKLDLDNLTIILKENKIWNHSIWGFIYNSLFLLIIKDLFLVKTKITNNFIQNVSISSLHMYVFHILILSGFYISKIGLPSPIFTLIFLIILIFLCYRFSLMYRKLKSYLSHRTNA